MVELAVTVSVVAILAAVALPSMRVFVQNSRASTQSNSFLTSLNMARSEALKRQGLAAVRSTGAGAAGNEFGGGWMVMADANGNGTFEDDETISQSSALGSGTLKDVQGTGEIIFRGDGTVGAERSFRLRVSGCSGTQGRDISVSRVGRASVEKVAC